MTFLSICHNATALVDLGVNFCLGDKVSLLPRVKVLAVPTLPPPTGGPPPLRRPDGLGEAGL